jgi:hypothetical protein
MPPKRGLAEAAEPPLHDGTATTAGPGEETALCRAVKRLATSSPGPGGGVRFDGACLLSFSVPSTPSLLSSPLPVLHAPAPQKLTQARPSPAPAALDDPAGPPPLRGFGGRGGRAGDLAAATPPPSQAVDVRAAAFPAAAEAGQPRAPGAHHTASTSGAASTGGAVTATTTATTATPGGAPSTRPSSAAAADAAAAAYDLANALLRALHFERLRRAVGVGSGGCGDGGGGGGSQMQEE